MEVAPLSQRKHCQNNEYEMPSTRINLRFIITNSTFGTHPYAKLDLRMLHQVITI